MLLGIFLLCGLGIPAWAMPPYDSTSTSAAAQDAVGTVWALSSDYNSDGKITRWQAGAWLAQAVPGAAGFRLQALTRGDDGSVYAFWQMPNQGQTPMPQCLVTVHRGLISRVLARFSSSVMLNAGDRNVPTLFAGTGGDVWLTGDQPVLQHISSDGSITSFPLKPEQLFGGKLTDNFYFPTIDSVVDGTGRRWFWQSGTRNNWIRSGLRGVLIWDGKTLAYHATLPGMPDRPFSVIAPLDANHVWLATAGDDYLNGPPTHGALYRVDTRTLSAVPEETPPHGAFQSTTQIFQANGDWYVVEQAQSSLSDALWRKRTGQWQPCVDNFEESSSYGTPDMQHPWLSEASGVWIGVSGGVWWLPRDNKPPIWVNWRRGLDVLKVSGLFPLADSSILAFGDPQAVPMPPTPQTIRPLPPGIATGGMDAPKYVGPLLADLRQHLWGGRLYTPTPALDEWDGKRWQTHLPPKSISGISGLYACDALGRLWLTTYNWHPPAQPQPVEGMVIYDPARDTWTNYVTVPDALQAAASLPGMAFLPSRNTANPPVFSGDGRVTYLYNNATLFLYDGKVWHHWDAHDLQPGFSHGDWGGPPHFNGAGHLEVVFNDLVWEWTPEGGLRRTGEQQQPPPNQNPAPPGGPPGLWSVPSVDALGEKWFTWKGAVYAAAHGLWAKQEELSVPNSPFRDGRDMEDVLRDPVGRLFFVTQPAGYDYDLIVWSPSPVPRPTLSVVPIADDAVTLRAQVKISGPHWFLWRLNGGAWSEAQTADTWKLIALMQGNYRVEVLALDCRLQSSARPAAAAFSIRVAPGAQIARWVKALLRGADDAREAAVSGLTSQPAAALPALQAARPGASEDGLWWLDAAIEQIEEQSEEQNRTCCPP